MPSILPAGYRSRSSKRERVGVVILQEGTTARLAAHIAGAEGRPLSPEVIENVKHHLLDTIAAIVSGSRMDAGEAGLSYVKGQGGKKEALVIGRRYRTSAVNAALANGMAAHADETDDSHAASLTHPGCAVVPAALAMAERGGASGAELIRAVAVGYDLVALSGAALGAIKFAQAGKCCHGFAGAIGAGAAAAAAAGLNAEQSAYVLSYAAQQASGVMTWLRDDSHVEKAFDFAGMPARNGVAAATMVQSGMTGTPDVFDGTPNFTAAFAIDPEARMQVQNLGEKYAVVETNIKRWSVGSPAQAVLDALEIMIGRDGLTAEAVASMRIRLPAHGARVVNNRDMPDINVQHLAALIVVDGTMSFAASHDVERMKDPAVLDMRKRIELVPDDVLSRAYPSRQSIVEISLKDGRELRHHTKAVRGTFENPMTWDEVVAKSMDLIAPILGKARAKKLVAATEGLHAARKLDRFIDLLHS